MPFKVELNSEVDRKLRRAVKEVPRSAMGVRFWKDLGSLIDLLTEKATSIGELCFSYKHSPFKNRLAARGFFAVQFAVSEELEVVFVQKLSLSGNHPYPPELDSILHED